MSGADDFLSRWSRRKLEAKRPDPGETPALKPEGKEPAASAAPDAQRSGDEELAPDLPDPESLTAQSDLAAFLREGIPERLRNAALRRMWSLDPGIRDFVGDARDYAYDWNSPGGVPGFGPILPGDDVEAMVAAIFGTGEGPKPEAEPEGPLAAASGDVSEAATERREAEERAPGAEVDAESRSAPVDPEAAQVRTAAASLTVPEPVHEIASPAPEARLRRHGGAKPV